MSPEIKTVKYEFQSETYTFLTANLLDGIPFEIERFDDWVKKCRQSTPDTYYFKYFVYNDTIYFFPGHLEHKDADSLLAANGIAGLKLGEGWGVDIFKPDGAFRTLGGDPGGIIYRRTVIREKLGKYFEINTSYPL